MIQEPALDIVMHDQTSSNGVMPLVSMCLSDRETAGCYRLPLDTHEEGLSESS